MQDNDFTYEKDTKESIETFISLVRDFTGSGIKKIVEAALLISDSINKGNTIYCCGNGGSAADSQHIAGEFIGRFLINRKPLPLVSLNTDTSVLTCIGNDFGFDQVYVRQIEALGKRGDVLMTFSTSGTSRNIMLAVKAAKAIGLKILSFTGKKGSQLESQSDLCICSGTEETYIAQQIHQTAYHQICRIVEEDLFKTDRNN
jgi:D-sedoheptulose 7-phosphate isomerase